MLYCEPCRLLYPEEQAVCPHCRRHGRAPQAEDLCLLTEQNGLGTDILEEMLRETAVPFLRRPASGVASIMGAAGTRWQFLVPFGSIGEARSVLEDFLTPAGEDAANGEAAGEADEE